MSSDPAPGAATVPTERTRLSAEDRRELVLVAATRAFARSGYAGTSTDAVAKEAGVSQPYVVRIFGTKLELFVEVLDRACEQVRAVFEEVLDAGPFDPDDEEDWGRLGESYFALLADRDLLMVMMHGFSAGDVAEIGACSRAGMGRIVATIMRTGCTEEQVRDFIAQGMLLNVMVSMRAHERTAPGDDLAPLVECAFGDKLAEVVGGPVPLTR